MSDTNETRESVGGACGCCGAVAAGKWLTRERTLRANEHYERRRDRTNTASERA
ncbi:MULTISPECIES: hypothetical protein [Halococcus]|uniref:hypothetical protein n=1 Tax=Halococcus TaxID=2249 RepID=UPI000AB18550|nr:MULTISPECIES: hypothetical protein [Halococcus]